MSKCGVPESVDQLVTEFDRFIYWAIQRFSGASLTTNEVEDLRQMVYLRIIEYNFLDRCRAYYAANDGRFVTSLSTLVRHVVYSFFKRSRADTLRLAEALSEYLTCPNSVSFVGRLESADLISKLGQSLSNPKRDVQISDVFAAAVSLGDPSPSGIAEALGMNPATVRSHLLVARRAARSADAFSTAAV